MIQIRKINLEYMSTALFGLIAMILSLATGLFAGVKFGVVIVRALIIMSVFAGIGFGAGIVLKKYVPELYEFLISIFTGAVAGSGEGSEKEAAVDTNEEATAPDEMSAGAEADPAPDLTDKEGTAAFKELDKDVLSHYSTGTGDAAVNTKEGKLGKHILTKEKLVKYEPKVMAQAVRTMMSNE